MITRQQMIEYLALEITHYEERIEHCCKTINPITATKLREERDMLEAILAELQRVDERTLPELPEGYYLHHVSQYYDEKYGAAIGFKGKHGILNADDSRSPREAVLNAISKIPSDQPKEN